LIVKQVQEGSLLIFCFILHLNPHVIQ